MENMETVFQLQTRGRVSKTVANQFSKLFDKKIQSTFSYCKISSILQLKWIANLHPLGNMERFVVKQIIITQRFSSHKEQKLVSTKN